MHPSTMCFKQSEQKDMARLNSLSALFVHSHVDDYFTASVLRKQ